LLTKNQAPKFEDLPEKDLAALLREFYASLRTKDGKEYSQSGYVNIRAGLNRHLTSPPYNKPINLMRDRVFQAANQVFKGSLKRLRAHGLDTSQHKPAIAAGDFAKMYSSGVLNNDTPWSLLRKVFVEVCLHFGRRGREGLRELRKDGITFKHDDHGREYATLNYNEADKNHQGVDMKEQNKIPIMYAQPADPKCPVYSLKLYLSKLNPKCDYLFQFPRMKWVQTSDIWYDNKPVGKNTLASMMKTISSKAELSHEYTNHCLRATTATALSDAGFQDRNIIAVTGHHNVESLKSYVRGPNMEQRKALSTALHNYGKDYGVQNVQNVQNFVSNSGTPNIGPFFNKAVISSGAQVVININNK